VGDPGLGGVGGEALAGVGGQGERLEGQVAVADDGVVEEFEAALQVDGNPASWTEPLAGLDSPDPSFDIVLP
jgi:hypothetical protein